MRFCDTKTDITPGTDQTCTKIITRLSADAFIPYRNVDVSAMIGNDLGVILRN